MKPTMCILGLGFLCIFAAPVGAEPGVPLAESAHEAAAAEETITVTGVVEEIDREDLTVTILTDGGRLLSLSAAGRDVIASLHAGDRVQIQIVIDDADGKTEPRSVAPHREIQL
jgi:hypothetical protein